MLQEIKAEVQSSIAPLLQGIVADGQNLLRQEIALAKSELNQEVGKVKTAAVSLGVAVALGAAATLLFCLTLVHALVKIFPQLELWGSYAVVTVAIGIAAGCFLAAGRRQAGEVNAIPQETLQSLKDNAQWLKQKI
ncbi:MAG: phage holin family protein [Deltaproteobacteria bacterium]|nr:phage holin family protein [Deltaproteobacteria bacterium]